MNYQNYQGKWRYLPSSWYHQGWWLCWDISWACCKLFGLLQSLSEIELLVLYLAHTKLSNDPYWPSNVWTDEVKLTLKVGVCKKPELREYSIFNGWIAEKSGLLKLKQVLCNILGASERKLRKAKMDFPSSKKKVYMCYSSKGLFQLSFKGSCVTTVFHWSFAFLDGQVHSFKFLQGRAGFFLKIEWRV